MHIYYDLIKSVQAQQLRFQTVETFTTITYHYISATETRTRNINSSSSIANCNERQCRKYQASCHYLPKTDGPVTINALDSNWHCILCPLSYYGFRKFDN